MLPKRHGPGIPLSWGVSDPASAAGGGGRERGGGLTPVGVRALGGDGGARAVHPYPLDAQLLQLPLQVSLLSLKLVYLMNGSPVTIFKFLQVRAEVFEGHR